jgi:seryl-tRNA synthetase
MSCWEITKERLKAEQAKETIKLYDENEKLKSQLNYYVDLHVNNAYKIGEFSRQIVKEELKNDQLKAQIEEYKHLTESLKAQLRHLKQANSDLATAAIDKPEPKPQVCPKCDGAGGKTGLALDECFVCKGIGALWEPK